MIICISSQAKLDSRSSTLLEFLRGNNKKNIELIISSNNNLFLRLLNITYLLLKIIISSYQKGAKIDSFYFMFNSYLIYPLAILINKLNFSKVIIDIGYSISEHTSFKKNTIKKIYQFIENKIMNQKGIYIFLESREQLKKFKNKFKFPIFHIFYMVRSYGIIDKQNIKQSLLSKEDQTFFKNINNNYILFRGRLNKESGILHIINHFDTYSKNSNIKRKENLNLIIQGWGNQSNQVQQLIEKINNPSIIFIPYFISNKLLIKLLKNSSGVVGQFCNYQNRLDYTIPNKFFEALYFNKLYITPYWTPLRNPYLDLLSSHIPIIQEPEYFSDWLIKNSELIFNYKIYLKNNIENISKITLYKYYSQNKKSISLIK